MNDKEKNMKTLSAIVVLMVLSFCFGCSYVGKTSAPKCVAGPDEICPSDQFYDDMQREKELTKEIQKKQNSPAVKDWREAIDLRNGMGDRLNAQIREQNKLGFRWADDRSKFVKMTPEELKQYIAQTQPQVPVPASPPSKK